MLYLFGDILSLRYVRNVRNDVLCFPQRKVLYTFQIPSGNLLLTHKILNYDSLSYWANQNKKTCIRGGRGGHYS